MVGRARRAVEGCGVPWMMGTMQSAERPLPFLALPKTNPASRQACRICSQGRSAVAAGDAEAGDMDEDDGGVLTDAGGAEVEGLAVAGEGGAVIAGVAGGLVCFRMAAPGAESVFSGCGATGVSPEAMF